MQNALSVNCGRAAMQKALLTATGAAAMQNAALAGIASPNSRS